MSIISFNQLSTSIKYLMQKIFSRDLIKKTSIIDPPHCAGCVSNPWLSSHSSFRGQLLQLPRSQFSSSGRSYRAIRTITMMTKPTIQFIQGTDELTIPDVKLTKSRDGSNGVALFTFEQPSVFDSTGELGDITGFYMIDEEGMIQSVDVSAKFVNGKPARVEAKYTMKSPKEWDRFMRFMERYSAANGLEFAKK